MISISLPLRSTNWNTISFASTLYLRPILDLLLAKIPRELHPEIRLGLQEALVNAAKHGNSLDPGKIVSVRYTRVGNCYWWIVKDQGSGFNHPAQCSPCPGVDSHVAVSECGRGLYILYQVFDQVQWAEDGRELHLCKRMQRFPAIFQWPALTAVFN